MEQTAQNKTITKQELWERKLLDLSLRNSLLNFRPTVSSVQLSAGNTAELENRLFSEDSFKIIPCEDGSDFAQNELKLCVENRPSDSIIADLEKKKINTYMTASELEKSLKKIHRQAKVSVEENGANTLYLALGFLKWYENDKGEKPRIAPILLVPVDIVRRNLDRSYAIRSRDEEPQINVTLLELLRQDFGIVAEGLSPLPADENGVDLPQVFSRIAEAVASMKNWEIINAVFLGHFSFSRFIMWNDIKSRSEDLKQNKVVRSLMEGRITFTDEIPPVENPDDIRPSALAVPASADSSQLSAIYEASNGKSFVLHGPPGTGKSQTITNMIANALYQGKTVLFVAEKMAALSVVQKRLAKLGLDPFCLELHSNKTQKRVVLSQLEKTLNIRRTKEPEDYAKTAAELFETREKLNGTINAVHKKQPCGMSLYELLVMHEKNAAHKGKLTVSSSGVTAERFAEQRTAVAELVNADKQAGGYVNSKLKAVGYINYTPELRDEFVALCQKLIIAANEANESYTALTGLNAAGIVTAENTAYAAKTALSAEYIMKAVANDDEFALKKERVDKLISEGLEYEQLTCLVREEFEDTVDNLNAVQAQLDWKKAEQSWFLGKMLGKSKLLKEMAVHRKKGKPTDEEFVTAIERLARRQTLAEAISSADMNLTALFGALWAGKDTDFPKLNKSLSDSLEMQEFLSKIKNDEIKEMLLSKADPEAMKAYCDKYFVYDEITIELTECGVNFTKVYGEYPSCFMGAAEAAGVWLSNADSLREHCAVVSASEKVNQLGLENVSRALMSGAIPADEIMPSFLAGFTYTAANSAISAEPLLSQFRGAAFEDTIKKFIDLDEQFAELTKRELVAKLSANVPAVSANAADSSEIGMLLKTIKNKGRMTPIRKLFDHIPNLLPRMCPCMLMSPISVAQYIDPSFPKFDLVIFDEASQLPTSEAVGAIARGENVVVVGDPNQLPPTSFFNAEHVDEENIEMEDLESVLDDCLALAMPQQKLEWHYRSRHESLIAYSNAKYYENSLLTFPSPDDIVSRVKYIHVDGFYDKSGTRQNRAEAEAVVAEIVRRINDEKLRQESIGVVTFSLVQQILIDDLLNEEFRKNPDLETLAESMYEPILIKNLENVQGDERDVIMFSIGYGPDKEGNVSMNFGPLNRDGGWRRLNVAITRARKEMQVFATITPDMIDLDRTDADGVEGLKGFLEFAQRGAAALPKRTAVAAQNDSLAELIAAELEKMGYKTRCNIGCSEYKIDIGVINPDDPESYILGIRCDGQRYLESGTARDRCLSQPSVLEGLGWNIHNVWILDVYDSLPKVLAEVGNRIEAELEAYRNPPAPAAEENREEKSAPEAETAVEAAPVKPANAVVYESYNPSVMGKAEDFYEEKSDTRIRRICEAVIGTEAPVSTDVLIKKVISAFDITRVTEKAENRVRVALAELPVTEIDGFLWQNDVMPDSFTSYRTPAEGDEKRSMDEIPPQEIANAVKEIIKEQISMTREDLVRVTAAVFGYNRIGGAIESAAEKGIAYAIEKGFVKDENGRVS